MFETHKVLKNQKKIKFERKRLSVKEKDKTLIKFARTQCFQSFQLNVIYER